MKKVVKVLSIVMAIAMVCACVAGCGKNGGGKKDANTILIGGTGPLTGDASSYGLSVKNGAQLAVEEINKAGGLNGLKFELDIKDDKATAEDAQTGYDALMDEGMQISIGSVTSGSCEAFAAKSVQDNLFFITPSASAAPIIAKRDNGFRICFGDPDQGVLAARELTEKFTNIGAIYDTSDAYSKGIYDAFNDEMKKIGKEFKTQKFDAENKKDFSTQVEALKDCDVIFLPIYYTEAGLIAKACVAKGSSAVVFGCDGLDGIADQVDSSVTNTIKYITPFDVNSTDEKISNFVAAYKDKYNTLPDQFAADGYDAIYAIYEAMKEAKIDTADIDCSELCDKVVKVITKDGFKFKGVTGEMTWSKDGAPTKTPTIVELEK